MGLQVNTGYSRLLQYISNYYRLLQATTGYYIFLQVTTSDKIKQFSASYSLTIYQGCSFEEYLVTVTIVNPVTMVTTMTILNIVPSVTLEKSYIFMNYTFHQSYINHCLSNNKIPLNPKN